MRILLVAATAMEIAPFTNRMPGIDVLITGVGTPGSIYLLEKRLQHGNYDLVIQAGIAGSFDSRLQLEEVVTVKQDNFADLGVAAQTGFKTVFELGFADKDKYPFKNGWLKNDDAILGRFGLKQVAAITVNTVSESMVIKQLYADKFDPQIETMEGAALHYVCLQENVAFLQLRSISNFVGERDKTQWRLKESINTLNEKLIEIFELLTADRL